MTPPPFNGSGLLALLALLVHQTGLAHPLQTDDAGVLDRKQCELETYGLRQNDTDERSRETWLHGSCGIGGHTQLELGLATATHPGEGRRTGLTLSGKSQLWQAETANGDGAALSLAWQLAGARTPNGNWRHEGSELRLLSSQPLSDKLSLHLNLGHAHNVVDHAHVTTWSAALEHSPVAALGGLAPMAELYGDDRSPASWNLGLRLTAIPDRLVLAGAWGRQFKHNGASLMTLGFKLMF